ncbi:restriction endonuclease [Leeia oryzae]|uniref:restriction endonuclease n=1 Tax=Leeia oryzae TaxID=356662 RepID=UPI001FE004B9|nr:restriction endonuclease [Leeia oryzae]
MATNAKGLPDISGMLTHSLLSIFVSIGQYLIPAVFGLGALLSLIQRKKQSSLSTHLKGAPTKETLDNMSWREFEHLCAALFREQGYKVDLQGGNQPDGGVDLRLSMGKDLYLVQCKHWKTRKVGVATVRELFGVMTSQGAVGGFVVASGGFTQDAHDFAEGRSIKLVPADKVLAMAGKPMPKIVVPQIQANTDESPACPVCNNKMVLRTASKGAQAGKQFWGCSLFPGCKGVRKLG